MRMPCPGSCRAGGEQELRRMRTWVAPGPHILSISDRFRAGMLRARRTIYSRSLLTNEILNVAGRSETDSLIRYYSMMEQCAPLTS